MQWSWVKGEPVVVWCCRLELGRRRFEPKVLHLGNEVQLVMEYVLCDSNHELQGPSLSHSQSAMLITFQGLEVQKVEAAL